MLPGKEKLLPNIAFPFPENKAHQMHLFADSHLEC